MNQSSFLETVLMRDRVIVLGALIVVTGLAWLYTLSGAGMPQMQGMGGHAIMQPMAWSPGYAALMLVMWWVMMVAMMVPSAAPMVLLFAAINRKQQQAGNAYVPTGIFLGGYLAIWGVFSIIAMGAQWGLETTGLLSPMMATASPVLGGAILVAAGLYQLTPLKQACLRQCRSPIMFITQHWRKGWAGAWRMGVEHGAYCLGCCWFLMALLFFGGSMNVWWIAGLALYVLFEKVVPAGHWLSYAAGAGLTAWGIFILAGALI